LDKTPFIFIIISASLFGISTPLAKLLVKNIPPVALAGLFYLGAFAGLSLYSIARRKRLIDPDKKVVSLEKKDFFWLAGAVLTGGIIGPISLMMGLTLVSGFSASLLLNLEGLATVIIAVFIFKENAGKRLWLALVCMTIAGLFLTWDPGQGKFSLVGPLLILLAMVCWGIDNNLTRNISDKDPIQITRIKGLVAGIISLSLALILGMKILLDLKIALALLLGSFSYGISLVFFIKALEKLGSSRAGAFFSFAPFIGTIASLIILREWIGWVMFPAAGFMIIGVWLIISERHSHLHLHKAITHTHSHKHSDRHHLHEHSGTFFEPHTHEHTHFELSHIHVHWPDTHHRHGH
jgi:drug/metabolite transporter (DMT)-like permease